MVVVEQDSNDVPNSEINWYWDAIKQICFESYHILPEFDDFAEECYENEGIVTSKSLSTTIKMILNCSDEQCRDWIDKFCQIGRITAKSIENEETKKKEIKYQLQGNFKRTREKINVGKNNIDMDTKTYNFALKLKPHFSKYIIKTKKKKMIEDTNVSILRSMYVDDILMNMTHSLLGYLLEGLDYSKDLYYYIISNVRHYSHFVRFAKTQPIKIISNPHKGGPTEIKFDLSQHIEFVARVGLYKDNYEHSKDYRKKSAKYLYKHYLKSKLPQSIVLSPETRSLIKDKYKSAPKNLFDQAKLEAIYQIQTIMPDFKGSSFDLPSIELPITSIDHINSVQDMFEACHLYMLRAFHSLADKEYSLEVLQFYRMAIYYQSVKNPVCRSILLKRIYMEYIDTNARTKVNLPSEAYASIEKAYHEMNDTIEVFDKAISTTLLDLNEMFLRYATSGKFEEAYGNEILNKYNEQHKTFGLYKGLYLAYIAKHQSGEKRGKSLLEADWSDPSELDILNSLIQSGYNDNNVDESIRTLTNQNLLELRSRIETYSRKLEESKEKEFGTSFQSLLGDGKDAESLVEEGLSSLLNKNVPKQFTNSTNMLYNLFGSRQLFHQFVQHCQKRRSMEDFNCVRFFIAVSHYHQSDLETRKFLGILLYHEYFFAPTLPFQSKVSTNISTEHLLEGQLDVFDPIIVEIYQYLSIHVAPSFQFDCSKQDLLPQTLTL